MSGAVLIGTDVTREQVRIVTGFGIDETLHLMRIPCVEATQERPGAAEWADEAWVRCGSGPLVWWLTCGCRDLWSHYSTRFGAVYYRHGDDLLKSTVNALDIDRIKDWARACPHGWST